MTHADPVETMRRLEEWVKKWRKFEIISTCVQWQFCYCTLYCPKEKKEAFAQSDELVDFGVPDRSTEFWPTTCDVIKLALDRWDGLVPQYGEEDGPPATTE